MSPEQLLRAVQFAERWDQRSRTYSERTGYQQHFLDLCELLGEDKPVVDPTGRDYTFERHVRKVGSRESGFADVYKRDCFVAEYKKQGGDLDRALRQALLYARELDNPPLLIVSDLARINIHTNFTATSPKTYGITLDAIAENRLIEGTDLSTLEVLRSAFREPWRLDPRASRERITQAATARIGAVSRGLVERGVAPARAAHFMIRIIFAMFAEDVGLLDRGILQQLLHTAYQHPDHARQLFGQLFGAMSTGGVYGNSIVRHFNGGLFDSDDALELRASEIAALEAAAELDWSEVDPAIFGTLFEQSLDDATRSQRGAHYTSARDILRIVEPVVLAPLRQEWSAVKTEVEALARSKKGRQGAFERIWDFQQRLGDVKVLDPACGSGNFLVVTLGLLLDLEHEVRSAAFELGAGAFTLPPLVHPRQMHGIEIEAFAHELASMSVWIAFFQWKKAHGGEWETPVLQHLENIAHCDALLDTDGQEAQWPEAEFIVGNPPFLGGKVLRTGLGDAAVDRLFSAFNGRVARESDLVCYWFEKARAHIAAGMTKRAGLVSTNSIRGGANRRVLQRIQETGAIFEAWDDEPWLQNGAAVRVSFICFDDGSDADRHLDGLPVARINADLTASVDLTAARPLAENVGISFMGTTKGGPFDIPGELARAWLALPNPSGRPNSDVVKPWVNGLDITRRPRDMWIIDFALMSEGEASEYVVPFEYVREKVKPERDKNNRASYRERWWQHMEARPAMRAAFEGLGRYLGTARVAKHRLFTWLPAQTVPDSQVICFARDDDFTCGVLHSRLHEVWALKMGTSLEDRPRYTPSTCFDTFPFPEPTAEQRAEVEKWARYLDTLRVGLLAADPRATLTGLYNALIALREMREATSPLFPLLLAHDRLDTAVAAAYGWVWPLSEDQALERLLTLNLERASAATDKIGGISC